MSRRRGIDISEPISTMIGVSVGASMVGLAGAALYGIRYGAKQLMLQSQATAEEQRAMRQYAKNAEVEFDDLIAERGFTIPADEVISQVFTTEVPITQTHDSHIDAIFGA